MKKSSSGVTIESIIAEGQSFLRNNEYAKALIKFNEALQKDAKNKVAIQEKFKTLLALANVAEQQKDDSVEIKYLTMAHDLMPTDSSVSEKLCALRHKTYKANQKTVAFTVPVQAHAIDRIVFQGGGIKGLAFLGACDVLFSQYVDRKKLKAICGTSAGGINALPLAFGYSTDEMKEEMKKLNFTDLMDGVYKEKLLDLLERKDEVAQQIKGFGADLARLKNFKQQPSGAVSAASGASRKASAPDVKKLFEGFSLLNQDQFGLFSGDFLRENLIERLIQQKTGIRYCTFRELHELHLSNPELYKDLYLIGANITKQTIDVFSPEDTPDDIISDAERITASIPGFFTYHNRHVKIQGERIKLNDDVYVDGGLIDNYPLWVFDRVKYLPYGDSHSNDIIQNPHVLGLRLVDGDKLQEYTLANSKQVSEKPTDLIQYFMQIISAVYHKQESDHRKYLEETRTIYIYHLGISAVQFDLDTTKQNALLEKGELAVKEQFPRLTYQKSDHIKQLDFWAAVANGDTAQLEKWLDGGFNLHTRNLEGKTCLDVAFEKNAIVSLVFLVLRGAMQTYHANDIVELLTQHINNPVLDVNRLNKALEKFNQYHQGLGYTVEKSGGTIFSK